MTDLFRLHLDPEWMANIFPMEVYMSHATEKLGKKNLSRPDETRSFEKGKIEVVTLGEVTFGRATLHIQDGDGPLALNR